MIASQTTVGLLVRGTAPMAWRRDSQIRRKLLGFSATEAGSFLDMLRAAELEPEAGLKRLFLRHALDEARHAKMFKKQAERFAGTAGLSSYAQAHAERQNLYENLGRVAFVAFVHRAERQGAAHFLALVGHFSRHPRLEPLFRTIARDEDFHVRYTGDLLAQWNAGPLRAEVRRAQHRVRRAALWDAWRRAGRRLGDLLTRGLLTALYALIIPFFAVAQRVFEPARTGWVTPRDPQPTLANLRRQF